MKVSNIQFEPTKKQFEAYQILEDKETTELQYGGALASGKSRIGCYWIILSCLKYSGTRYLIGRARLQNLKRTTLRTFLDIAKEWGIEDQFNYNRQDSIITFKNGSEVILMDLYQNPSDPDFVRLGSLEITGALIDEASEISEKVYNIIKTRLRYKLGEYNLIPKLFITSNPSKGWLYDKFYRPSLTKDLPTYRKFIQALPHDNHYNTREYLDSLTIETLSEPVYKRLVLGDWEYDDTDYSLFEYDDIVSCFRTRPDITKGKKYITCDPAGSGADSTVITFWEGWHCQNIIEIENSDTQTTVNTIRALMSKHEVQVSHVIVDMVGLGKGVYDLLKGCKGFVANAKPFKGEHYKSLKDQCYYKFADAIMDGIISIEQRAYQETISQELEAHKIYNADNDGKAQVTPKKVVKTIIGKSPDFADALTMRSYFAYKNLGGVRIIRG